MKRPKNKKAKKHVGNIMRKAKVHKNEDRKLYNRSREKKIQEEEKE